MKIIPNSIKTYHRATHSLLYSYLISLPLLFLYELLIYIARPEAGAMVRIAVDVWIKHLFTEIGYGTLSISLIAVFVVGLVIFFIERKRSYSLKMNYFMMMILEAMFYAIVLALLIANTLDVLLNMQTAGQVMEISMIQKIALSLGAGLYEELFFRVILVSLLVWIFKRIFEPRWAAYLTAAITAAVVFSLAHYTGSMGDPFTLGSFLFRFLFGLALNAIYVLRGFGMAAWTHALYDIMVVAFLS